MYAVNLLITTNTKGSSSISSCPSSSCTPHSRLDHGERVALEHAPEDAELRRRVGRVPGPGLAEEAAAVQHGLPVGEGVEAEGAVIRAHAALADSAERQVWVCQLQCTQFRKEAAVSPQLVW